MSLKNDSRSLRRTQQHWAKLEMRMNNPKKANRCSAVFCRPSQVCLTAVTDAGSSCIYLTHGRRVNTHSSFIQNMQYWPCVNVLATVCWPEIGLWWWWLSFHPWSLVDYTYDFLVTPVKSTQPLSLQSLPNGDSANDYTPFSTTEMFPTKTGQSAGLKLRGTYTGQEYETRERGMCCGKVCSLYSLYVFLFF